jgi:hypothetical protein
VRLEARGMISLDVSTFAATVWYLSLGCFPPLSLCGFRFRPISAPLLTHLVIFGAAMLCVSLEWVYLAAWLILASPHPHPSSPILTSLHRALSTASPLLYNPSRTPTRPRLSSILAVLDITYSIDLCRHSLLLAYLLHY